MTTKHCTLWSQFQALSASQDGERLSACRIAAGLPHYLAKGSFGEPMLLLGAAKRISRRVPLRLRNVSVDFELECALHEDCGATTRGTFLRIACDPHSDDLHAFFLDAMSGLVLSYPSVLSSREADELVEKAVDLFSKLAQPAKKSVVGLWGELFIIQAAPDVARMVHAWHGVPTENFDFSDVGFLEVKTTESPDRVHEVSLEQVRPASRRAGTIASVMVQRSSSGLSVLDLAEDIVAKLRPAEVEKVWRVLADTLGQDASCAAELRFDLAHASNNLRFLRTDDVPAPQIPEGSGALITGVRYRVGLAQLVVLDVSWHGAVAALFGDQLEAQSQ